MVDYSILSNVDTLYKLKVDSFKILDFHINYIIDNNICDCSRIMSLLDMLIDCVYDEYSISRCLYLCDYFSKIDENSALVYFGLIKKL